MACGCENTREIFPNCDMSRWEVQCSSYIEDADNYYTKPQIDEMLEEIESAITSGCCITPEEVDEKIDEAVSGKQDTLSAGTNIIISGNVISASGCDLTDYYTKEQVDERIPHYSAGTGIDITDNVISCTVTGSSGCGCDLSDYVTFEDMAEYVGDVYTKTEVNNLFVTKATFNTYITNLQQQIDSLKEAISGCCGSTGETEYRWIVIPNDYTCSGTTKMTKEKQQSSTDGINWTDTGQYRTGSTVLEYNSVDCGYTPSSNYKVRANYKRGYTVGSGQVECNSSTTLTNDELKTQITFPAYFTSVEFGSCIDTIGEDAFINGGNVSQVIIPSNIKTLDTCAFSNCGFASYQINEGLTTIGTTAFINNYNLTAITIPSSVTSIGSQAFFNCTGLTTVTVLSTTPPTTPYTQGWNSGIFDGCGNLTTIYVPAASVNTYKAADGWILYADKIQAIP